MQKLKRNINLGFRVTEAEKELIEKRMAQTGISNQRAYLLKMAVDGLVVNLDLSDVNECSRLLRTISNNVIWSRRTSLSRWSRSGADHLVHVDRLA